jgi:hypothetical protein
MLNEVELGDRALEYIKEELAMGNAIAESLWGSIKFDQGVIRTFLPDDVPDTEILDFRDSIAEDYQAMYRATHKKLADFITAYLSHQKNSLVVFETLASPRLPYPQREKPQYFSTQQNFYVYLAGDNFDEEKAGQIISEARGYPCIGILTSLPNGKSVSSEQFVSDDFVKKLVEETEHFIIGAFDEDGFLLWSKHHA